VKINIRFQPVMALALSASLMLLAGCGSTVRTLVSKDGKLTMTEERCGGISTWELKEVSSAAEVNLLRKTGWHRTGTLHQKGGPDIFLMKRKMNKPTATSTVAAPPPFHPMFITAFGTNTSPDGSWRIGVKEDSIDFTRPMAGGIGFTTDSHGWRAQPGWFVFTESESRVWSYDGDSMLYLAAFTWAGDNINFSGSLYVGVFTESSSRNNSSEATHFGSNFPCAVPMEVISRLPERKQKAIQTHE